MNLDKIKERLRQNKALGSFFKNPFVLAIGFIIIAISLVNFSDVSKTSCPAVLTYDEIYNAIDLQYCQLENGSYEIEVVDKSDFIHAEKIQFTVNGDVVIQPWSDSKIIVNSLPDYVMLNLLFSGACFKNNSTDVSFPIDLSFVTRCDSKEYKASVQEDDIDLHEIESEDELENSIKEQEQAILEIQNSKSAVEKKSIVAKVEDAPKAIQKNELQQKPKREKTSRSLAKVESKKSKPIVKTVKTVEASKVDRTEEHKASHHGGSPSVVNSKNRQSVEISKPRKEIVEQRPVENKIVMATNRKEESALETTDESSFSNSREVSKVVASATSSAGINLFNTKTIGIKKSCIESSNRSKSKTDLFAVSVKASKAITLYDIYCYAAVNSEMTITLSQLGKVMTSFNISLNKGENQIGLTSLGLLEANEAYLIECKTKNSGDVYLFSACEGMLNQSSEIVLRYLDNHSAFYGLTYEIELQ